MRDWMSIPASLNFSSLNQGWQNSTIDTTPNSLKLTNHPVIACRAGGWPGAKVVMLLAVVEGKTEVIQPHRLLFSQLLFPYFF
jgi:hypothetical protein